MGLLPGKSHFLLIRENLFLFLGETIRITLTVENTVKKSNAKKHQGVHKCTLLSLCQQLDFKAKSRTDPNNYDEKSLTTAVHSCVSNDYQILIKKNF